MDEAGDGLHVSVCFAPDRGDEHDHHALDLLLGHLAALWRTVLRQEELERGGGPRRADGAAQPAHLRGRAAPPGGPLEATGARLHAGDVDLDHFKLVNDSFGHPEGDTVLRRSGEAIRGVLRGSDRVFRVGGEEFALMLETADRDGVTELLERAREAVKALGVEPSVGSRLSASIGWAVYPNDADERSELIAQADAALYRAKQSAATGSCTWATSNSPRPDPSNRHNPATFSQRPRGECLASLPLRYVAICRAFVSRRVRTAIYFEGVLQTEQTYSAFVPPTGMIFLKVRTAPLHSALSHWRSSVEGCLSGISTRYRSGQALPLGGWGRCHLNTRPNDSTKRFVSSARDTARPKMGSALISPLSCLQLSQRRTADPVLLPSHWER